MTKTKESFLYTVLENIPDGIAVFKLLDRETLEFRYEYVNQTTCDIVGYNLKTLIGKTMREAFPEAYTDGEILPKSYLQALDTGQQIELGHYEYGDDNLETQVYRLTCKPIGEDALITVITCIKELVSAQAEASQRYKMMLTSEEAASLGTAIVDIITGKWESTPNFENLLNLRPDDLRFGNFWEEMEKLCNQEDWELLQSFRENVFLNRETTFDGEIRVKSKGYEDTKWMHVLALPLDADRYQIVFRDISTQKKQELKLRSAERMFRELIENSPVGITLAPLNRTLTYINPTFCKMVGYSAEELLGMDWKEITFPEDQENNLKEYNKLLSGEKSVVQFDKRYITRNNGVIWCSIVVSKFYNVERQEEMVITSIRDVTRRKNTEEALKSANKELEQFVYSVSHDLRAPVRHIESYTQILEEEAKTSEESREMMKKIISTTKRLGSMIDDLLAYSRTRNAVPEKKKIDTHLMVSEISEEFSDASPTQNIHWQIENLHPCFADKKMMRVVWENLISNSIKYSSQNEEVHIRIWSEVKDNEVIYSIQDNGAGFDMRFANKLFLVFQRLHTRRQFPGHGIGLANVARILSHHKGKIWGEGEINKGATFQFSLPIMQ